jgi:hypothetical protein
MSDDRGSKPRPTQQDWRRLEAAQRRRLARLPLADKLAWLEEAQQLVEHLNSPRKRRG